eukprot:scaffold71397_cov60-Phaeocystis_antarctica.AAC.1
MSRRSPCSRDAVRPSPARCPAGERDMRHIAAVASTAESSAALTNFSSILSGPRAEAMLATILFSMPAQGA